MLVIERCQSTVAVKMSSIEVFSVRDHGPYNTVHIRTNSGKQFEIHHPLDELGHVVDFNLIAEAILADYTMWRIIESKG